MEGSAEAAVSGGNAGIATETAGRNDAEGPAYTKDVAGDKPARKRLPSALDRYGDDYQDIWQKGGYRKAASKGHTNNP